MRNMKILNKEKHLLKTYLELSDKSTSKILLQPSKVDLIKVQIKRVSLEIAKHIKSKKSITNNVSFTDLIPAKKHLKLFHPSLLSKMKI